jgi:alpha-beta hydrolase superfamily lysophospholipase
MLAELVRLTTSDGKTHYGAFYPAEQPSALGVVLVHGMTGSFVGEIESAVPPMLAAAGLPTLAANNRGNGLLGAATETVAGVLPDIAAAIDALQARGFARIVLIGHSKGGAKVSYYMTQTKDPRIVALGLLSPGASFHFTPAWLAAQFSPKDAQHWLKKAKKLAAKGKGERIFTDSAWPYLVSAGTLADHAAAVDDDVLDNLTRVRVPVLAACGSLELDWCTVVATLRSGAPDGFRVAVVAGADHVYTGKERELADLIIAWVKGL